MSACACNVCKTACRTKPGLFSPGEAERLADAMGLSMSELLRQHLMIDWFVQPPSTAKIFVLAPAIVGREGRLATENPEGRCTFLTEAGRCSIHELGKPKECRDVHHKLKERGNARVFRRVAESWLGQQHRIREYARELSV